MSKETTSQAINPPHYRSPDFDLIDYLEAGAMCLHLANAVQCVTRFPFKGQPQTDLAKGMWYLDRLQGCDIMLTAQCMPLEEDNFLQNWHHDRIVEAFFNEDRLSMVVSKQENDLPKDFRNILRTFYWQVNMAACAGGVNFLRYSLSGAADCVTRLRRHYK